MIRNHSRHGSRFPIATAAASDPYWSSVSMLLHGDGVNAAQNNTFLDGSTNNFTVTRNGNTTQGSFNPFVSTYPYAVATNGGSAYFDGTGDYLTVPDSTAFTLGTNDFTIECWVNLSTFAAAPTIAGQGSAFSLAGVSFQIGLTTSGGVECYLLDNTATTYLTSAPASSITINTWAHIAFVRNGSTLRVYVNGVQKGTSSFTFVVQNSSDVLGVGSSGAYVGQLPTGYISNFRLVNGTCLYPSGTTFTPPTAPLTAVTNTALLLGMSNAAIYDNAELNNLETVASAQISTSVFKYGTGALSFNGTTDYLNTSPANQAKFAFGAGDFTIEMWVYTTSIAGFTTIYDSYPTTTSGAYPSIQLALGVLVYNTGLTSVILGSTLSANTWYHVAVARSGASTKMFLNGTQTGSTYTDSNVYLNTSLRPYIGLSGYNGAGFFPGYIDDLRVTKGIARYTTTFTPPTAAFPNK